MQLFFKWAKRHFLAILCSMAFAITLFALLAPWLFATHSSSVAFNSETGVIGDTFGIMNPFVAIAAAIITFAAFWTQYQANQEMQKNSYRMQFERQFYEMLKIHCDNVKNLHAESQHKSLDADNHSQKNVNGHEYFCCLLEEFNLIYDSIKKFEGIEDIFNKTYQTFFFGINSTNIQLKQETADSLNNYVFQNSSSLVWEKHPKLIPLKDTLCKGRMDLLVPYYRHLFLMVKTVVQFKDDLFSYEDKRQFLRILRAQLSSAEQVLLYYNWKSGCGEKWEEDSSKPDGNHFFTDYRIIHNIIPKDCRAFNSDEILKSLLDKNPNYKKIDDDEKDTLFELIE